ncbi:MAG TPA: AI-2E family transporter [Ktedonobacteraceae bacterium]|nr:AI-2E family transporter [Ktedonobacteraceae bacterium]
MSLQSSPPVEIHSRTREKWKLRRDIPLAILAWIAVIAVILWAAGHVVRSLLLLAIASLLAYALAPAVKLLQRVMPRFLAILVVYLLVLSALCLLIYLIINTAVHQVVMLSHFVRGQLTPVNGQGSPFEQTLISFGISQNQIEAVRQQIIAQTEGFAISAVPLLRSIFDFVLDTIIVAVLSIYLMIDGERMTRWLRTNMPLPHQGRVRFFLDTLERIIGGYIRGQLILSLLIGLLVGFGMALLHVPFAILLGVLAFVFAFVPVLGTFISGAACVLLALTQGWVWAVIVLIYFIGIHIFEGDLVGPRIVGKAVGLHPVVSLAALIAGSELFGIWGAIFASPIAGILQAMLIAFWVEWRESHADQFKTNEQAQVTEAIVEATAEKPTS